MVLVGRGARDRGRGPGDQVGDVRPHLGRDDAQALRVQPRRPCAVGVLDAGGRGYVDHAVDVVVCRPAGETAVQRFARDEREAAHQGVFLKGL